MAKKGNLPKFTLEFDEKRVQWELQKDKTGQVVKRFNVKENATKRDVLRKAIGPNGGSVKIQKVNGRFQSERTYPKSKDPKRSPG